MRTAATLCIELLLALVFLATGSAQDRRASFEFERLPMRRALDSLMVRYSSSIIYLDDDVEGRTVTVSCSDCTLDEALARVLASSSLEWIRTASQVILRRRMEVPREPRSTVAGVVTDSVTGSGVGEAMVLLRNDQEQRVRWCTTNEFGFYSLRGVPPGSYTLTVRALGYQPVAVALAVDGEASTRRDLIATPQEITLPEVTIEALRTSAAPAEGFARGVFIRSAPSDQHQYFLDGARIYNPSHFGGVLSTFSADVLNEVQVAVGAMPPSYGGRIGGMLDLSMRDGSRDRLRGSAGTGSLGSSLALEGPLGSSASYLMSVRRGYPEPLIPTFDDRSVKARTGAGEVLARASTILSGSSRLTASIYWGSDAYTNRAAGPGRSLSNTFAWGNQAVNLRWAGIASPTLFLLATAVYTRYHLSLEHALSTQALPYSSSYTIEDVTARAQVEQYFDEDHTFRGGAELTRHRLTGAISEFSMQQDGMTFDGRPVWEFSVYLQDQWRILRDLRADIGGRLTTFAGTQGSFSAIDPRISLRLSLDSETALLASVSAVNQFLHPYRGSGVFLLYPTAIWYPSTREAGPTTALQAAIGGMRTMADVELSVDAYYRTTSDLHGPVASSAPAVPHSNTGTPDIITGTGRLYGIELAVRRRSGNPTGSLRYVLARADQAFPSLNGGAWTRTPFDIRHQVHAAISVEPLAGWSAGMVAVLGSVDTRSKIGASTATMNSGANHDGSAIRNAFTNTLDLNGSLSPGFQRLELSLHRYFSVGKTLVRCSLRLVNGYGLLDPFRWEVTGAPAPADAWVADVERIALFPLYPVVSMNIRF